MLYWTALFLFFAVTSGLLGFSGITVNAALLAEVLFPVFALAFVLSLLSEAMGSRTDQASQHTDE
jgi:uncharacterized membrane protein YtjA (UPF0391 family)